MLVRRCQLHSQVVLFSLAACQLHAVEIVAHRGASHDAPENTLASFQLGWDQGADADELDVHLTKDGQILVIHDARTKRTAGRDAAVANQTLDELRSLDAGSWKGEQWKGEKLPALREVLAALPEGKRLFIEIKCGPEILPELERVLTQSGKQPGQLVLIGFGYDTLRQAKQRFSHLQVYWIVSYDADKQSGAYPDIKQLIEKAQAARLDGLDLNAKFPIDAEFVSQVKTAGLQLHVWTVDDAVQAERFAAAGVEGITTNRPGWLREQLTHRSDKTQVPLH